MKGERESDESFVERLAGQAEEEILRVGSDRVAGFVAETVLGLRWVVYLPFPGIGGLSGRVVIGMGFC
jgi:adenosylmethionine-8-amino-7-oxononanoate aminotransferase